MKIRCGIATADTLSRFGITFCASQPHDGRERIILDATEENAPSPREQAKKFADGITPHRDTPKKMVKEIDGTKLQR